MYKAFIALLCVIGNLQGDFHESLQRNQNNIFANPLYLQEFKSNPTEKAIYYLKKAQKFCAAIEEIHNKEPVYTELDLLAKEIEEGSFEGALQRAKILYQNCDELLSECPNEKNKFLIKLYLRYISEQLQTI